MLYIYRFLLVIALFLQPSFCLADEVFKTDIVGNDATLISKSKDITLTIEMAKSDKDYIYKDLFGWGADKDFPPKRIIKIINIIAEKENINVPLSAYMDLAEPHKIELKTSPKKFEVIIIGGDASLGYTAVLNFKKNQIVSREVKSGEFPNELWEQTKYRWIQPGEVQ